jgi:hypothetical protein
MKIFTYLVVLLLGLDSFAQLPSMSVDQAKSLLSQTSPEIQQILNSAPKTYDFKNQDRSSVNYSGPVMRQVLINDAKLIFSSLNRGQMSGDFEGAYKKLNFYYNYNYETNGLFPFLIKASGPEGGSVSILEGIYYSDIYFDAISLSEKMAGSDIPLPNNEFLGWDLKTLDGINVDMDKDGKITPDELMKSLLTSLANNISSSQVTFTAPNGELAVQEIRKAHISESGLDLAEFSQKLFHTALSFSQAAGSNLSVDLSNGKGLLADNTNILENQFYTQLQHQWDEAYGYFGAARNYLDYSDEQIAKGISLDSYSDNELTDLATGENYWSQVYGEQDYEISLMTEKNLGLSGYAGRRDMGAKLKNTDFTSVIADSFIKGRYLIQEKPQDYLKYAQAYSIIALAEWEKVIASSVVHYINDLLNVYSEYGSQDYHFEELAKNFSEMKGLALAFQFNPSSLMSRDRFITLHKLMGDTPVKPETVEMKGYQDNLIKARDLIENTYSFDPANVKAW